jgi:hypothetical protein
MTTHVLRSLFLAATLAAVGCAPTAAVDSTDDGEQAQEKLEVSQDVRLNSTTTLHSTFIRCTNTLNSDKCVYKVQLHLVNDPEKAILEWFAAQSGTDVKPKPSARVDVLQPVGRYCDNGPNETVTPIAQTDEDILADGRQYCVRNGVEVAEKGGEFTITLATVKETGRQFVSPYGMPEIVSSKKLPNLETRRIVVTRLPYDEELPQDLNYELDYTFE